MILLDTHVLLWLVTDPNRLSRPAASVIRRARVRDGMVISDITLLELAILFAKGRVRTSGTIEDSVQEVVQASGVIVRPITPLIATLATQFPEDYPRDPADRLIGATARAEGIALVTRDQRIQSSPLLKTIW